MRRYGLSLISEPPDHTTGVVTYATELARHLPAELRRDERLVIFRHARFPAPVLPGPRVAEVVLHFPLAATSAGRRLAEQTLLPLAASLERLTLLHSVQNFGPLAFPGPQVVTVHDARLFASRSGAAFARRLWREVVYPASIRRAARLMSDSAWASARCATAFGLERDRLSVVPLAVDHSALASVSGVDRERVRARLGLEGPVLLYAGLFGPNKNLPRLVAAFARSLERGNEATLVLAGGGGSEEGLVRERVSALGLAPRVRLPGYLPRRELLALLQVATALVFPSLEEGFGLPVLEAFAAGTPVLTSSRGALLELAGDAALLVDPEDEQAIALGIERLLREEPLRRDLRERGRERASLYTWSGVARAVLEVYRGVRTGG